MIILDIHQSTVTLWVRDEEAMGREDNQEVLLPRGTDLYRSLLGIENIAS